MNDDQFTAFFYNICENKQSIVKLSLKKREQFKLKFFNYDFPKWRLWLIWEFIWDDRSYEEVFNIFNNKKILKK